AHHMSNISGRSGHLDTPTKLFYQERKVVIIDKPMMIVIPRRIHATRLTPERGTSILPSAALTSPGHLLRRNQGVTYERINTVIVAPTSSMKGNILFESRRSPVPATNTPNTRRPIYNNNSFLMTCNNLIKMEIGF